MVLCSPLIYAVCTLPHATVSFLFDWHLYLATPNLCLLGVICECKSIIIKSKSLAFICASVKSPCLHTKYKGRLRLSKYFSLNCQKKFFKLSKIIWITNFQYFDAYQTWVFWTIYHHTDQTTRTLLVDLLLLKQVSNLICSVTIESP